MTTAGDSAAALAGLATDARTRLDGFSRTLDRLNVEDLPLYVARVRHPRHRRAVETAELVAIESGLVETVDAVRRVVIEQIVARFGESQFQVWVGGVKMAPNVGSADERVQIARSLGDAVTAMVLGDRLDAADSAELLGLWDRLLL
jgi:hypothetical protein